MPERNPPTASEGWNVDGRRAFAFYAGTVSVLAALVCGSYLYWCALFPGGGRRLPPETAIPPPPRLQVSAPRDRSERLQQQSARLDSYGWIDRPAGIAHIPIGRAMQLRADKP